MSFYEVDPGTQRLNITDWQQLLVADGFDASLFNKRHQDCPICNRVDGFRAGQLGKNGDDLFRFVCKGCTNSKYQGGYEFLAAHHRLSSGTDVFRYIYQEIVNNDGAMKRVRDLPQRQYEEWTPEKAQRSIEINAFLWTKSREVTEGDAVWKYLKNRIPNLNRIPSDIHYAKARYYEGAEGSDRPVMVGEFDAMTVRGWSPCEKLVQLHTTYLTPDGNKAAVTNVKKTRPGNGYSSFAFRIGVPEKGILGLSEGIETGLSASLLKGIPVWPCHSASVLENFEVPDRYKSLIHTIVIFADNDRSKVQDGVRNTGLLAAQSLAKKLRAQGYKVIIEMTSKVGDFNDHYLKVAQSEPNPAAKAPFLEQCSTGGEFAHKETPRERIVVNQNLLKASSKFANVG